MEHALVHGVLQAGHVDITEERQEGFLEHSRLADDDEGESVGGGGLGGT